MKVIIILVLAFFIWRHFSKKKKGTQATQQTNYAPQKEATAVKHNTATSEKIAKEETTTQNPEVRTLLEDLPVYTPDVFWPTRHRGNKVAESSLPSKEKDLIENMGIFVDKSKENPDYTFACTKKFYELCLADYKAGQLKIEKSTAKNERIINWFKSARHLVDYYQSGYGCDQDYQAALQVMLPVNEFFTIQSDRDDLPDTDEVTRIFSGAADNWLSLAKCYAGLGQAKESAKFHRMALDAAKVFSANWERKDFETRVVESAMGGYPLPAAPELAAELALKLVQRSRIHGAYAFYEALELQKMDYQKLGKSDEQDAAVFLDAARKNGGAYAASKLGYCYLYGKGVKQDVVQGLSLLKIAAYANNYQATCKLAEYFNDMARELTTNKKAKLNHNQEMTLYRIRDDWEDRESNLEENTSILDTIQKVLDGHENAEQLLGKRELAAVLPVAPVEETDESPKLSGDTLLADLPHLITDDNGREWEFDDYVGEAKQYKMREIYSPNFDAKDALNNGTILIEQKHIHGRTATLFSRTFHW